MKWHMERESAFEIFVNETDSYSEYEMRDLKDIHNDTCDQYESKIAELESENAILQNELAEYGDTPEEKTGLRCRIDKLEDTITALLEMLTPGKEPSRPLEAGLKTWFQWVSDATDHNVKSVLYARACEIAGWEA